MLEQVDHRGKRFTIDDAIVDEISDKHPQRRDTLEQQAQREARELEHARAATGPAGATPDVEELE